MKKETEVHSLTKEDTVKKRFKIKSSEHVVVITLFDKSFGSFCDALKEVPAEHKDKKILMMQSGQEDEQPMKIVIVFEF